MKSIKLYGAAWIVILIAFQVLAFLYPAWPGKFTGSFWTGYALGMIALIGFLIFGLIIFREKDATSKLYLAVAAGPRCFFGMLICGIAGCVFMAVPQLPEWIGGLIGIIVLAYCLFYVFISGAAGSTASAVHRDVEARRQTMADLTVQADRLQAAASADDRQICREVYEAFRYSDPMSSSAVSGMEAQIKTRYTQFETCVRAHDPRAGQEGKDLLALISERNKACKAAK